MERKVYQMDILEKLKVLFVKVEAIQDEMLDLIDELEELELDELDDEIDEIDEDENEDDIKIGLSE
jgi:hypothetical protein